MVYICVILYQDVFNYVLYYLNVSHVMWWRSLSQYSSLAD
jgi:hypothetical protein